MNGLPKTTRTLAAAALLLAPSVPAQDLDPAQNLTPESVEQTIGAFVENLPWEGADGTRLPGRTLIRGRLRAVGRDAAKLGSTLGELYANSPFSPAERRSRLQRDLLTLQTSFQSYSATFFGQHLRASFLDSEDAFRDLYRGARRASSDRDLFEDTLVDPRKARSAAQDDWIRSLNGRIAEARAREDWDAAQALRDYQTRAQALWNEGKYGRTFLTEAADAYRSLREDARYDASLLQFGQGLPLDDDGQKALKGFQQGVKANGRALDAFRDWVNGGARPADTRIEPVSFQTSPGPVFSDGGLGGAGDTPGSEDAFVGGSALGQGVTGGVGDAVASNGEAGVPGADGTIF